MGRITPSFIFVQTFLFEILSSHAQPSLAQYLQLAGFGHQSLPVPAPQGPPPSYSTSPGYGTPPSYQTFQTPPNYHIPPRPATSPVSPSPLPTPLSAIASLAASAPAPKPSLQKTPAVPKASESLQPAGLDSNVLNNLAIALQLLIVSNILNMPALEPSESLSRLEIPKFDSLSLPKYETIPISPASSSYPVQSSVSLQTPPYLEAPMLQALYLYESSRPPNSNFIGSSGFIEPTMFGPAVSPARPNPRSSMALMSPYEALGPSSPFSDPILSSVYSPSYSKKDFQSPYASILAADGHSDLFSVTDLF